LYKNDAETLYRGVIDSYYEYYLNAAPEVFYNSQPGDLKGYSVPLSVIDTQELDTLLMATRSLLPSFIPHYPESLGFEGITFYFQLGSAQLMYDMRAMMQAIVHKEDLARWENAFRKAVPYFRMSKRWMTIYDLNTEFYKFTQAASAHGCVSMFVPCNISSYTTSRYQYNQTFTQFEWHRKLGWERFGWTVN
jgi:hypothetical protein